MNHPAGSFRHSAEIPYQVDVVNNPTQNDLRGLAQRHAPHVYESRTGNLNRITRCKARMAQSTYIIAPMPDQSLYSCKVMLRERAERLIQHQREFIERGGGLIRIDGYLGPDPHSPAVQWLYSPDAANIAGMQQVLAFGRDVRESAEQLAQPFEPELRVIMTPR